MSAADELGLDGGVHTCQSGRAKGRVMAALATWLLTQIAEDERQPNFCHCGNIHSPEGFCLMRPGCPKRIALECDAKRRIIALHGPTKPFRDDEELDYPEAAALCATCGPGDSWEAKQEPFGQLPCEHLRLLALPYADRPGYRTEWAP